MTKRNQNPLTEFPPLTFLGDNITFTNTHLSIKMFENNIKKEEIIVDLGIDNCMKQTNYSVFQ